MSLYACKELKSDEIFEPLLLGQDISFTQSFVYGSWQEKLGRKVLRVCVYEGEDIIGYFQAIQYPLVRNLSCLYMPYGPILKKSNREILEVIKTFLVSYAEKHAIVFSRLDFSVSNEDKNILDSLFTKASVSTLHSAFSQPRHEWYLDITKMEHELLKGMHKNTRYCVNVSEKKGVVTHIYKHDIEKHLERFFDLMTETSIRNNFGLHPRAYYEEIFKTVAQLKGSFLITASYNGEVLVADLVIVYGKIAHYVFGSSSNVNRDVFPSYAAQWQAILEAKKSGCTHYNFGGVLKVGETQKGWEGLTKFKERFGGEMRDHVLVYDVVSKPFWYYVYNLRKVIKKFLHEKTH